MAISFSDPTTRILRLFTILFRIAGRRPGQQISRRTLAETCECSIATIKRDLNVLRLAHVPLDYDPQQRSFAFPAVGWKLQVAALPRSDALALGLALSLLSGSAVPQSLTDQITTALAQVTSGLSPAIQEQMRQMGALVRQTGVMARDYSHVPLDLIMEAGRRQVTVQMLYDSRSSGACTQRFADPYRVDHRDGLYWEMQAWCHNDKRVKTFALDRIQQVRLTEDTFIVQPWDDSDKGVVGGLRDGGWIEVVVHFDPIVAPYARDRLWPFVTTFEALEDGSVILRGEVRGTEGIVRELLSWRSHATVLGGAPLRERMTAEVRAMAALYTE